MWKAVAASFQTITLLFNLLANSDSLCLSNSQIPLHKKSEQQWKHTASQQCSKEVTGRREVILGSCVSKPCQLGISSCRLSIYNYCIMFRFTLLHIILCSNAQKCLPTSHRSVQTSVSAVPQSQLLEWPPWADAGACLILME